MITMSPDGTADAGAPALRAHDRPATFSFPGIVKPYHLYPGDRPRGGGDGAGHVRTPTIERILTSFLQQQD